MSSELVATLSSLQLPQSSEPAALSGSVAVVRAFRQLQNETFWTAFPWCLTGAAHRRSTLADSVDQFLSGASNERRQTIEASVELQLTNAAAPPPLLAQLTQGAVWPMHRRAALHRDPAGGGSGHGEAAAADSEPLLAKAAQQTAATDQLAAWATVERKQRQWAERAAAAMEQAQRAAADDAARQQAYALQMAAWVYQMGAQQQQQGQGQWQGQAEGQQLPPGAEHFNHLAPNAPRLQYEVASSDIAPPVYAVSPLGEGQQPGSPFMFNSGNMNLQLEGPGQSAAAPSVEESDEQAEAEAEADASSSPHAEAEDERPQAEEHEEPDQQHDDHEDRDEEGAHEPDDTDDM